MSFAEQAKQARKQAARNSRNPRSDTARHASGVRADERSRRSIRSAACRRIAADRGRSAFLAVDHPHVTRDPRVFCRKRRISRWSVAPCPRMCAIDVIRYVRSSDCSAPLGADRHCFGRRSVALALTTVSYSTIARRECRIE